MERIQQLLKELNQEFKKLNKGETLHISLCNNNKETYTMALTNETQVSKVGLSKSTHEEVNLVDEAF